VNFVQWGNASLYNFTFGYIGTISANWTAIGYGDAAPSYGPTPAVSSRVDVGSENGTVYWMVSYNDGVKWHNDTVILLINPPTVDYIEITDAPGGSAMANITVEINYNVIGYASLYNFTRGYIRTVSANWTAVGIFGANPSFGPAAGNSSLVDAGGDGGAVLWNVSFFSGTQWFNDSVRFNVNPPGVDYIEITETPGGTLIVDDTVVWNYNVTGYASLYNLTEGWVGTIVANWSALGANGSAPFIGPNASVSSWINVGTNIGTVLWNISYFDNSTWYNDSVKFTVVFPGVDSIEITLGPGGTNITDETVIHNHDETGYASLFNATFGYLLTIPGNWSAEGGDGATPSSSPAQNVSSWVNVGFNSGIVWWNVSYFNGTNWYNDTMVFTVVAPVPDSVEITDVPNGVPIPNAGVNLGYADSGNVSLYNTTFGYLGTVVANWTAEGGGGATPSINTTVGVSTSINVGLNDGTVWWNVSYFDGINWHNDTVTFIINPPTVDFISITDAPGGSDITNATVPQTFTQIGYASLYNNTKGYIGTIEANWTAFSNDTAVPTYNTTKGITCSVNVGPDSGTVIWQISYFDNQTQTWFNDTVQYIVISPVTDYIDITDGAGGPAIADITVGVGYIEWGTASLFNNTIGFYQTISSNWSVEGRNGASPSMGPTPAASTWVNVGFSAGTVWWNVSYFDGMNWHNDTVVYTVLPPSVDYLQITDTPGGTPLSNKNVAVGDIFWGNASLYNNSFGYLFSVEANWSAQGSGGATPSIGPTPAVFSWVDVGLNDGTVQWTSSYFDSTNWFNDTVTYNVLPPTADEIFIVDAPGSGASEITDQTVDAGFTVTGYAAGYNDTVGYFGDIIVTWNVQNSGGAQAFTSPGSGDSSQFNSSTPAGSAIWIADDGQGHNDTVSFTINPPTVDFIQIVDSQGMGTTEILDGNANVGSLKTGFAAAYNNSVGYIYDISVSWSVSNGGGSTAYTTPSSSTKSTFNASGDAGTATWTANDGSGHTDTVVYTIIAATLDEIKIVDSSGSGTVVIPDHTIGVGIIITGYAAAFNNTIGYIYDVSVNWSVANASGANASTNPLSSSTTSDLYSGYFAGTVTWTAEYSANHTYTVIFTINPPSVDYILIVESEGTGSSEVPDQIVDVGTLVTGYAATYNSSIGYLGDISVSWSVENSGGATGFTNPSSGSNSSFNSSSNAGTSTWTADDGSGHTDIVIFSVNSPTVDDIFIVGTAGTGSPLILDQTVDAGFTITGYAAAYNDSVGYFGEIAVDWSVSNSSGAVAETDPASGTSSQFNASSKGGSAVWTADDGSGHTSNVTFTINPPTVDLIIIVDSPSTGSVAIPDQIVTIYFELTGYAASFNNSVGYIGDISVSWYVMNSGGSSAQTNPSSGNSSMFNASSDPGLATWTADDGNGHTDTVIFEIIPYSVDYILIVDMLGTGITEVSDQTVDVGITITGYAAAFNNTAGYIGDFAVNWTVNNAGGATAQTNPSLGSSSQFNSSSKAGTATWKADDGNGHTDTVVFTINPPSVDNILIVDSGNTGGSEVPDTTIGVGWEIDGYAAAFNHSIGYFGDISVTWTIVNGSGATAFTSPSSGTNSQFNSSVNGGSSTWMADDGAGHTDTVVFIINSPAVDYILIVDTEDSGASEISGGAIDVGVYITGYAAAYNNSIGYFADISVSWFVLNAGGAAAETSPSSGSSSTFYSGASGGTATWEADDGLGHSDIVSFSINPPILDYILIVDTTGTGTSEITNQTVEQNINIIGYSAGFNNSVGYLYDVSVTWSVVNNSGASASTSPSSGTSSQFDSGSDPGYALWTADDGAGNTHTVQINITGFNVDYIVIVDAPGNITLEIQDQTVDVGFTITGYAAAFNFSAPGTGYIGDVSVSWTVDNVGSQASTNPVSGISSEFDSGVSGGTATWTADDGSGHTDTVIFTVNSPVVDYVMIVDTADSGSSEIPHQSVGVVTTLIGYAGAFNNTIGYMGDISVSWSVINTNGSTASTNPASGSSSQFNSSVKGGTATWIADDGFGNTDSVIFTINPPTVDYIEIVDMGGMGASEIPDGTVDVGIAITGYAAAFNYSLGYLADITVSWSVTNTGGASATTNPTSGSSSAFYSGTIGGTAQWKADDGSGHTDTVGLTINPPTLDYIIIVDTAGSGVTEISDQTILHDSNIQGHTAGFNSTIGYLYDVSVSWSVSNSGGATASTSPPSGTSSQFDSGPTLGTAVWKADGGSGLTDNVTFYIIDYNVDYILIVDIPGSGAAEIVDQTVDVGIYKMGYAAAFNFSAPGNGYIGDVSVSWSVDNVGSSASTDPVTGTGSEFNSGATGGSATWTADDGSGNIDTVVFTVNSPVVDYILIVDTAGTGITEIPHQNIDVASVIIGHAAAFNTSIGYMSDVSVSWIVINSSGAAAFTNPGSGTSSLFNSGVKGGTATWTADDGSGHSDTVEFIINPPSVDYLIIMDSENTGTAEISNQIIDVGITITGYAAAFNNSIGYIADIPVAWSVINASGASASTSPQGGSSSEFNSGDSSGTATWIASDGAGHSDTVIFTIDPPTLDYILIVDTQGTGINEISDQTIMRNMNLQGFAAGFNSTIGYIYDVSVSWSVSNSGGATASTSPPSGMSSQFDSGPDTGSATWTADDGSGHTDTVTFTITGYNVDYILIVDTALTGNTEIPGQTVDVGFVITGYAAAFNFSAPGSGYIGDVSVTWYVDNVGSSAITAPGTGTSSLFNSSTLGGTATWWADDGLGHTDSVVFSVNPPTVDHILIVDTPGTGANDIPDQSVSVVLSITGYAAAYNDTIGYMGDISVDWSVINASGAEGSTSPLTGSSSEFYSGAANGTATWIADDGQGHSDSVVFTVSPPAVDYIRIVDVGGSGGVEISDDTVIAGYIVTGYAAAFNISVGYIGDISVDWSVQNTGSIAFTSPASGTNSLFNASGTSGTATWTADDGQGHTDSVVFTILPPIVDYIAIVDAPGAGASLILDQTVNVGITIMGFAAAFNNSIGYMFDVTVDWSVLNTGFANASTSDPTGLSSIFYSGWWGGTATWTADDLGGHIDTVVFTVNFPVIDYLLVVDTSNTGLTEIPDQTVDVGFTLTGYAAVFNNTLGYIGDGQSDWTVDNVGGAMASTNPALDFNSDFNAGKSGGTATWTATLGIAEDTVIFTINPPQVDEIYIVDTPGTGSTVIPDQTLSVDFFTVGYAAAFNNTIGFMWDIPVTWWVVNLSSNASTAPLSGSNTSVLYTGHFGGTVTWWADDGAGHTFSVTFTILAPTVDYIQIVNIPGTGTFQIPTQNLDVGMSLIGYAAAFNSSIGFLGDITVAWSVDNTGGASASTTPSSDSTSIFNSGTTGGSANWTADDGAGHTDTVTITINPPSLEYILIVDTADTGTDVITDQTVLLDVDIWGYAAGFNNTIGYVYDVSVMWSVINSGGADATTTPSGGTNSLFNSGLIVGSATWTADDGSGHIHTISFTITDYSVDYIEIVDTSSTGATVISDQTVDVGVVISGYAAAFNYSAPGSRYIGDISVSWSVLNTGSTAITTPGSGVVSDFYSGDLGGTAQWRVDDGAGHTYSVTFTVNPPEVDYILIVDTMGIGSDEVTDKILDVGISISGYAASFNNSIGFMGDISVSWSVNNMGGASASTNPLLGITSDFYSGSSSGSADWIADDGIGHSDSVTITINPPIEDYLVIVDSPGTGSMVIQDQTVDVGFVITGYAAMFNNTIGYLYDISVDWSVGNSGGSTSFTSPLTGSSSEFNASKDAGTATLTANDGSGHTDTVVFIINPHTVDYIIIVDTPGAGASSISDGTVGVAYTITGYAAAFNSSVGYMGDIVVSWDIVNVGGASAFTNPGSGTSSQFNAGITGGSVTWRADDGAGHTDTVQFTINPPSIDYIIIVDTSGTGSVEIPDQNVDVGISITGYAAAFNNTIGYLWDASVAWSVIPSGSENAYTAPLSGKSSEFNSGTVGGSVTWTADYGGGITDTVSFTINPPTLDYITIVDSPGSGINEISDQTVIRNVNIFGYAAAFNHTVGYLNDVSVVWSVSNIGGATASIFPLSGNSSQFNSGSTAGSATWTADDGFGHTDTVMFDITIYSVDYILIVDTPDSGVVEIADQFMDVGMEISGYTAAFNFSAPGTGYLGDISVSWTVNNVGTSSSTTPSSGTGSVFLSGDDGGTATWIANDGLGHNDTVVFTVNPPSVDYIVIVDTLGTGTQEIPDQYVDVGIITLGYAAAFNDTVGYLYDISVDWDVILGGGANATTSPLSSSATSVFYSGFFAGTATWRADDGTGNIDTVSFTVNAPVIDYILIVDTPNSGFTEIADQTVDVGFLSTGYAASFNYTIGFLGDISVDWTVDNLGGALTFTNPAISSSSTFNTSSKGGQATWTADDGQGHTDTVAFTINPPTVDEIFIVDTAATGINVIPDQTVDIGFVITGFAAAYNNSIGYMGDITVDWNVLNFGGASASTFPLSSSSSMFNASYKGGSATWTADDGASHTHSVTIIINPPIADFIILTDFPDGQPHGTVNLAIYDTVSIYASGYNTTSGYIGPVDVAWIDAPDLGSFTNDTGTSSIFTAGIIGGTTTITGQNISMSPSVSDDFTVFVLSPTLDYIVITDEQDGNPLGTVTLSIGESVRAFASGYNNTMSTFLGLVNVDWLDVSGLGSFDNTSATNTIFTAGYTGGSTTITAQDPLSGKSDDFSVGILPPTLDYILITDSPEGTELTIVDMNALDNITVFASGYNTTGATYIGLVLVNWTDDPDLGSFDNDIGTGSIFSANTTGGTTTITALHTSLGIFDTFSINIAALTVDFIIITDAPDGRELGTEALGIGGQITFYASGYNNTGPTYVGLVSVFWSDLPDFGSLNRNSGNNAVFTAGNLGGWVNITGRNTILALSDLFFIDIAPPIIDVILITDSPDGQELTLVVLGSTFNITLYASGYNSSGGTYLGLVDVTWTADPQLGSFETTTGNATLFTAGLAGGNVTISGTAFGISGDFTIIVVGPTVDYILITDAADGIEIPDQTVPLESSIQGHASAYNLTVGYLFEISATWNVNNGQGALASTSIGQGTSSTFDSGPTGGRASWIASDSQGHADRVVFTIPSPTVDYIRLEDGDGNELTTISLKAGEHIRVYAAGYNNTALRIGYVTVSWSVDGGASLSNNTGTSTTITAREGGTFDLTAEYDENNQISIPLDTSSAGSEEGFSMLWMILLIIIVVVVLVVVLLLKRRGKEEEGLPEEETLSEEETLVEEEMEEEEEPAAELYEGEEEAIPETEETIEEEIPTYEETLYEETEYEEAQDEETPSYEEAPSYEEEPAYEEAVYEETSEEEIPTYEEPISEETEELPLPPPPDDLEEEVTALDSYGIPPPPEDLESEPIDKGAMLSLEELEAKYGLSEEVSEGEKELDELESMRKLDEEGAAALEELQGIDGLDESITALADLEDEGVKEPEGLAALEELETEEEDGALADLSSLEEEVSDAPLKCPSCGSPIAMDMKKCPKCGTEFEFV
jgi:hypothetical protein